MNTRLTNFEPLPASVLFWLEQPKTTMTKIELLEMLTKRAKKFREDRGHYERNKHMHAISEAPPQEVVDAVLTGFINDIGLMQGIDYALYAYDLAKPDDASRNDKTQAPT